MPARNLGNSGCFLIDDATNGAAPSSLLCATTDTSRWRGIYLQLICRSTTSLDAGGVSSFPTLAERKLPTTLLPSNNSSASRNGKQRYRRRLRHGSHRDDRLPLRRRELLHHSDRGCQYTSDAYQRTLKATRIECSMSRVGECYDNAVAERFFWSLKHEWTKHESFCDLEAKRLSVFKYIETFYNPVRLHQTLGFKSPDQLEAAYAPTVAA
jgi:putative transposase